MNPVASWDAVPDHGLKFNGDSDQAFVTTSSTGLDIMSQGGFSVNGDSIEPRCVCDNGMAVTSSCSAHEDNHCGTCDNGYYLSNKVCVAYAGSCANGALIAQASRTQDNHCGSCDNSYYLSNKVCVAYAGSCANGALIAQASRTQDNHCGSCDNGTYLSNKVCVLLGSAVEHSRGCAGGRLGQPGAINAY